MSSILIDRLSAMVSDGEVSRSGLARAAGLHANSLRRLGEADWNEALNAFLAELIQTPEYAAIYEKRIGTTPPEFPESIPNIPYTVSN